MNIYIYIYYISFLYPRKSLELLVNFNQRTICRALGGQSFSRYQPIKHKIVMTCHGNGNSIIWSLIFPIKTSIYVGVFLHGSSVDFCKVDPIATIQAFLDLGGHGDSPGSNSGSTGKTHQQKGGAPLRTRG